MLPDRKAVRALRSKCIENRVTTLKILGIDPCPPGGAGIRAIRQLRSRNINCDKHSIVIQGREISRGYIALGKIGFGGRHKIRQDSLVTFSRDKWLVGNPVVLGSDV